MPLPIRDVLRMIGSSVKRYGFPVPVPKDVVYRWAYELGLPKGGDTVLFTGGLYQLIPYIDTLVRYLEGLEESRFAALLKADWLISVASKLFVRAPKGELEKQYGVLRSVAELLRKAGVQFGYLYEDDMYSGALLYDMGLDDYFKEHAEAVYSKLKSLNVRTLITIDPHTTYLMKEVYGKTLSDYDLKVKNYLEVLANSNIAPTKTLSEAVVLHDPCYYARYLRILDEPRKLLRNGGVGIVEPDRGKELTFCCGGPIESITPRLSKSIAQLRMEELAALGNTIVTMCPICYVCLSRVKPAEVTITDISHYLHAIYG